MSNEEFMPIRDEDFAARWELPSLVGTRLDVVSVLVGHFEQGKERLGFVEAAIQNIQMNGHAGNSRVNVVLAINAVMERSTPDQFVGIMAPGEPGQSDPRFLLEQELPPGPISHKTVKAVTVEIPPDAEYSPETGKPDVRIVHIHPYWTEDGLCMDVVLTVYSPTEYEKELPATGEEWNHEEIEVMGTGFPQQGETVALAWRVGELTEAAAKEVLAQVVLDPGENNPLIVLENKNLLEVQEIVLGPPRLTRQGEQWTLSGVAKVKYPMYSDIVPGINSMAPVKTTEVGPGEGAPGQETNIELASPYAQAFLDNPLAWYRGLAPTAPPDPNPTEKLRYQPEEISASSDKEKEDMVTNRTELEVPVEIPVTAETTREEEASAVIVAEE
ncbi:MAG: hypothetical protein PHC60_02850, partial [Heliobacteriaceae bacterium]|nr:hypothetical protein [Heliobacteriaceae bacterium]